MVPSYHHLIRGSLKAGFTVFVLGTLLLANASAQIPEHLQKQPLDPVQRGEFMILGKKYDEAAGLFRDLWRREPENLYAVRGLVRALSLSGKLSKAEMLFRDFLKRDPQSSAAYYGLGYTLYLAGRDEEAAQALSHAVKLDSSNALALNVWGAVLARLENFEEAVEKVKQAITVDPDELMFYRNLKKIYADSGKPERFVEEYQVYLQEGAKKIARGYGMVYAQNLRQESFRLYVEGKIDAALAKVLNMLAVYREIDHTPGVVAALFSLAVLHEEKGDRSQAAHYYREVLKINPNHIQARKKIREFAP